MVDRKRFFLCSFCILLQTSSILTFYFQSRDREDYLVGSDIYSDIKDGHKHHLVKRASSGVKCYKSTFGTRVVQKTTVETCVAHCWYERCVAALLKKGSLCKCLPELSDGKKVDSGQCHIPCAGNKQQNCGGSSAYAAYMTGYVHEPFVQRSSRYYPRNVLTHNIGCFIPPETVPTKALTIRSLRITFMLCSYLCYQERHNFAGVFQNDGCFCFWSTEGFTKTSKSKCSVPCAGHDSLKCGGANGEMNIFETLGNFDKNAGTDTTEYQLPAWIAPPSQMIKGGGPQSKVRVSGRRRGTNGRPSGVTRRNNGYNGQNGESGRRRGTNGRQSSVTRRNNGYNGQNGESGRRNPPQNRKSQYENNPRESKNIQNRPRKDRQIASRSGQETRGKKERAKGRRRRKGRRNRRRRRKGRGNGRRRGRRRRRRNRKKKTHSTRNVNKEHRKTNEERRWKTGYDTGVKNEHRNRNRFSKTRNGNAQRYDDYGSNAGDYNSEDSSDDYNEENGRRSKNIKRRKDFTKKEKDETDETDETEGGGFFGLFSRGATLTGSTRNVILTIISCYTFSKYMMSL